ncbi:MAG: hypothetical protein LBK74_01215, partial [Treponema sp.]|nr:hypothetical protein [Treponema sp.]
CYSYQPQQEFWVGTLAQNEETGYSFTALSAVPYVVQWEDNNTGSGSKGYTGDITVKAYRSDLTEIPALPAYGSAIFTLAAGETIQLRVIATAPGSYGIRCYQPQQQFWTGTLAANGSATHTFPVSAGTYFVEWADKNTPPGSLLYTGDIMVEGQVSYVVGGGAPVKFKDKKTGFEPITLTAEGSIILTVTAEAGGGGSYRIVIYN